MLLEMRNDTLIQTWPVNGDGQIDKSNYRIEKLVRVEESLSRSICNFALNIRILSP